MKNHVRIKNIFEEQKNFLNSWEAFFFFLKKKKTLYLKPPPLNYKVAEFLLEKYIIIEL